MSPKIIGKYILSGRIVCLTGLHIGGSTTGLEIGGVDNPVIKDPITDQPIVPGSSLKGKLRSLTEWNFGLIEPHEKHKNYQAYACNELKSDPPTNNPAGAEKWQKALAIARMFGPANDDSKVRLKAGPTRLTVRDAFLSDDSIQNLQKFLGQGSFTEVKTENALDRVTSEANPRPLERVPANSEFELSLIFDKYEADDHQLLRHLFTSMAILENSALGGGGSRGSGQIAFRNLQIIWRSTQDYEVGTPGAMVELKGGTPEEILKDFDKIAWPE
jgi:CRISPR-associated protein Csm3